MTLLKSIIIDDEQHCVRTLMWELDQLEGVDVVATTNDPLEGIDFIEKHQPDLVFLDIEMPGMSGFDLLEKLGNFNFNLIFTTAYDEFAIRAFESNASAYLLKPIGEEKLRQAVENARQKAGRFDSEKLEAVLESIRNEMRLQRKIALPMADGMELVASDAIIYCKSDSNYTNIILDSGRKLLVSKTLKDIEQSLQEFNFFRVHKSYLINPAHISKYIRSHGGSLIMSNGDEVTVSKAKKEEVMMLFSRL